MTSAVPAVPAHEAVLHSSPSELARLLAPRVREALGNGSTVVAVLAPEPACALRTDLGAAADGVEFADPARIHAVPAFTAAMRLARTARRADKVLVIGQHVPELPGCGSAHWARFDIALNVAIAGLPVTVLCPYAADDPDLPIARSTHPVITDAAGSTGSASYRPPREAVIDYPPPPPPTLGAPTAELVFSVGGLSALRRLVGGIAATADLTPDRTADLVLAVSELASNSVEHGTGRGRLRIWAGDPLVAEVSDDGGGFDVPFPGLTLPPPDGARGRGLWLASELCDVLQVWSEAGSTVIRVHLDR